MTDNAPAEFLRELRAFVRPPLKNIVLAAFRRAANRVKFFFRRAEEGPSHGIQEGDEIFIHGKGRGKVSALRGHHEIVLEDGSILTLGS